MCSSPSGSSKSTPNKPRSGGLFADMSPAARLSFAAKANAADDRKTERLARQKRRRLQEKSMSDNNAISSANLLNSKPASKKSWFSSVSKMFVI